MGLRKIDISELDSDHTPKMSYTEYLEELKKPRRERRGLPRMPADMCMSPEREERFIQSSIAYHQRTKADKARAIANAYRSNCL